MSAAEPRQVLKPHFPEPEADDPAEELRQRVRSLQLPDSPADGKRRSRSVWVVWLLLAAAVGVIVYLLLRPSAGPAPAVETPARPKPVEESPQAPSGGIALESKGYLIPAHQILVSPKVSGMVRRLRIQEGQRVIKGEVLAEVEDTDYRADFDRARGIRDAAWQRLLELYYGNRPEEIAQAQAELSEMESQLPQVKAEMDRNRVLLGKNALPQQDYEVSESKYWAMFRRIEKLRMSLKLMTDGPRIERIDMARADVRQAEADLSKAKWRLENCTIRAPISGTILKKNAEEGNIVNPIAFNGSFSVCEMADLADLEVDLSIQERDVARVFQGQRCKISAEAYPKRLYDGFVSRLMPIADRAKGAIPVRVKVAVPSQEEGVYLKPEMTVSVSFFEKD